MAVEIGKSYVMKVPSRDPSTVTLVRIYHSPRGLYSFEDANGVWHNLLSDDRGESFYKPAVDTNAPRTHVEVSEIKPVV